VWEPEDYQMTAASKDAPRVEVTSRGFLACPTPSCWVKADVFQAETGYTGKTRRGMGPSAYTKTAEITSGTTNSQQGLAATCKDWPEEHKAKPGRGISVGRMSQYERRRPGNAGRGGARRLPEGGNAHLGQRGSRWVAGDQRELCLGTEPGSAVLSCCRRAKGITAQLRGACEQALKPRALREGPLGKAAAANRTREIRPSGMRGGLVET
jgi:hypothetical protein